MALGPIQFKPLCELTCLASVQLSSTGQHYNPVVAIGFQGNLDEPPCCRDDDDDSDDVENGYGNDDEDRDDRHHDGDGELVIMMTRRRSRII